MSAARDISALPGDLAALERILTKALQEATTEVTRAVYVKAKAHEWRSRTGATDNQIVHFVTTDGDGAKGVVASAGPLTFILNDGSRSHLIWPRAAAGTAGKNLQYGQKRAARGAAPRAVLRIPLAGGTIFRPYVQHPGTRAYKFMDNAADLADELLDRVVDQYIEHALDSW
jgi:hypothetical protein